MPVKAELDPALIADCAPAVDVPQAGPLSLKDTMRRLAAVEDALFDCRMRMSTLRSLE